MTPVPRLRFHDTLGVAVQRSDGSWAVTPHEIKTERWIMTAEWMATEPGVEGTGGEGERMSGYWERPGIFGATELNPDVSRVMAATVARIKAKLPPPGAGSY